ncbi:DUF58 domain-containing protein [Luteolibacter ambystomatis]|uniref:DUF58 domain-containing protein n=1 Tax=Luteolibacter ambystomatis TaxID=2824561 RepID=A0A975G9B4_9BACT|nr:DUF58 domain-containing protein [Luteolibacter ambystomatis]QUE51203.1 DUF58 domain-containing protein [Luteolibacter ambystomatis]
MSSLTDPAFIRQLDALNLLARRVLRGSLQADRRTQRRGTGITFADYAPYNFGDDYRAIDWKIYARTEELLIKLFEIEEDTTVYILFDCSRSMATKFDYARKLAAAIGYIALNGMDRVMVYGMAEKLSTIVESARSRSQVFPFLRDLEGAETFGVDTDFSACARTFQARKGKKGVVLVVSDFFFPKGFEEGLRFLQWSGHDVFALQVHDPADLECPWLGDLEIECVETAATQRVTISEKESKQYREAIAAWNDSLKNECARRGVGLASTTSDVPFDVVIQSMLRKGGLVA